MRKLFSHKFSVNDPLGYSIRASIIESKKNMDTLNFQKIVSIPISILLESFEYIKLLKIDIEGAETAIWEDIKKNFLKFRKIYNIQRLSNGDRENFL